MQEHELREALNSITERFNLKGHLFLYLEGDRIKMIGDISLSSLAPLLMKALAEKLIK